MYNDFFGLKETPFTISPDPRYLFMSERHRDALAHLLYGIGAGGGFVLLTGEVGTGKTTVCRCLLEQLPQNVRLAYILNPKLNAVELMATMCDELGIEYERKESSLKAFTDLLSHHLLNNHEKGLNTVLMIDEAQNLSVEVLEQIRLLTNLETNQKKLLQIILIGQPELQELLAKKELRQLAQRITARYHLRPLSLVETKSYLEHRLRIAGVMRPVFKDQAIKAIHKASQGIPRLINVISDRSMLGAFSEHRHAVDTKTVFKAVEEVLGHSSKPMPAENSQSRNDLWWKVLSMAALVLLAFMSWTLWQGKQAATSADEGVVNPTQSNLSQQEVLASELSSKESEQEELLENKTIEQLAEEFWGEQSWDRQGLIASRNLLALWGVSYMPFQSTEACRFAESYSLGCDSGIADWEFLTHLNRPVNLKFTTGQTGDFWGTLIAVEGHSVVLQFGDNQVRIEKKLLNPLWQGEYQLFWKKPLGYYDAIGRGSQGEVVGWLIDNIKIIDGIEFSSPSVFNSEVEEWLRLFQIENGLVDDGILGKHSVMMINNQSIKNIPRLVSNQTQEAL